MLFQVKETSAPPHRSRLEGRPPPAGDRDVAEGDQRQSHTAHALCGTGRGQQTRGRPPGPAQGKPQRLRLSGTSAGAGHPANQDASSVRHSQRSKRLWWQVLQSCSFSVLFVSRRDFNRLETDLIWSELEF